MSPTTEAWLRGLRAFADERRGMSPLATPGGLTAADSAERSILGASLALRVAELELVREARRGRVDGDPEPAIAVTTSPIGIEVIEGLLASSRDLAAVARGGVVPVTEVEYRQWCMRQPDPGYRWHVNLWSWLKTRVPVQRIKEFEAYPIASDETYWLHREGLAGGGALDRRACHLWRWNGRHASLLRAFIAERSVTRLGGGGE